MKILSFLLLFEYRIHDHLPFLPRVSPTRSEIEEPTCTSVERPRPLSFRTHGGNTSFLVVSLSPSLCRYPVTDRYDERKNPGDKQVEKGPYHPCAISCPVKEGKRVSEGRKDGGRGTRVFCLRSTRDGMVSPSFVLSFSYLHLRVLGGFSLP